MNKNEISLEVHDISNQIKSIVIKYDAGKISHKSFKGYLKTQEKKLKDLIDQI